MLTSMRPVRASLSDLEIRVVNSKCSCDRKMKYMLVMLYALDMIVNLGTVGHKY